MNAENGFCL